MQEDENRFAVPNPDAAGQQPVRKKKKRLFWKLLLVIILLLAGAAGGYMLSMTPVANAVNKIILDAPIPQPTSSPDSEAAVPVSSPAPEAEAEKQDKLPQTEKQEESQPEKPRYIGAEAAAELALKHAQLDAKDADISAVLLRDDGEMPVYAVSFSDEEHYYSYELDAGSGRIESWQKEDAALPEAAPAAALENAAQPKPAETVDTAQDKADDKTPVFIGEDEAKKLAMKFYDLSQSQLKRTSCKLELEGLKVVYDVEMYTAEYEYSCDVDAITGEIISHEKELRS